MKIEYPTNKEISEQKEKVLNSVFDKESSRVPGLRVIFYNSNLLIMISLLIYGFLLFICYSFKGYGNEGYLVLTLYPATYFCFYYLSLLSEEQCEIIDLKRSMKYSFSYIIGIRMLCFNVLSVFLNLGMIGILRSDLHNMWNLAATGTTANIILALLGLIIYEKTNSSRLSGLVFAVWCVLCVLLMQFGEGAYHFLIEVVPLAVHLLITLISFIVYTNYIGKVEKQNAYGF